MTVGGRIGEHLRAQIIRNIILAWSNDATFQLKQLQTLFGDRGQSFNLKFFSVGVVFC